VARAAVKAKQQAKTKAQPAKARARGRRRHSGGGDPNQQLFFMRLRRRQKWVYAALAVIFALTFVAVGVGSGTGGLSQLYSGIFGGGGGGDVAKAKDEIKTDPAKGYRDLATAYETSGHPALAITALQSYLKLKKNDANAWTELGGLEQSQARKVAAQYQQAQQAAQLADPSAPFQPSGTLAQAVGTNPAYSGASQQASARTSQLYQQATAELTRSVNAYKTAAKLQPRSATAQQQLALGAENAGDYKTAVDAWKGYIRLAPSSPQRHQIEQRIKQLQKALAPAQASSGSSQSSTSGR
jgi:tetratricopeptide (TPR) repeat protein